MLKGAAVLIAVAGLALFSHRPLTRGELETVRTRLQIKIEAVGQKIDRLSQQVQTLNNKMDRLDRRFAALQKHFNIEQRPKSPGTMEQTSPLKSEEHIAREASPATGSP